MIKRTYQKLYIYILLFLGLVLSVVSCSKSIFDGDHSNDQKVSQSLTNHSCFDIDLSSNQIDPGSFRNLIRCLNDNGSITEYAALVNKMTDEQLSGFLDIINQIILPNQKLLESMVQTFDDLEKQGVLDSLFNQLSQILTQKAALISGLQLIHQAAFTNGKLDPTILNTIQILTHELDQGKGFRENIKYILEKTIRYTQLDSYQKIIKNLAIPIPGGNFTLRTLCLQVLKYIQEKIKDKYPLSKLILWGIKDGSFYKFLYQYLYPGCSQPPLDNCSLDHLDPQVQAAQDLFEIISIEHKEDVLKKIADLFIALDRPIDCLDETKRFLNGGMYLIDLFNQQEPLEVPAWFLRNDSLLLKFSASQCKLPKNFNSLIEPLRILADYKGTNSLGETIDHLPLVTTAYLLRALSAADQMAIDPLADQDLKINHYPKTERYRRMFLHWLGDPSPINIYTHLADTIGILAQKNILTNAFYFMNSVSAEADDKADWVNLARILLILRPELQTPSLATGQNIYDVLTSVILPIDSETLYKFLANLTDVLRDDQDYLIPTLNILREAWLTNDQSPFLEIFFKIGSSPSYYSSFFNSIFELSETKEFEDALQLTAKLSQNGDLKEILRGFLSLFGRIQTGKPYLHKLIIPVASISQRQNQSSSQPGPTGPPSPYWPQSPTHSKGSMEACKKIDVNMSLADTKNEKWSSQMTATIDCLNANGDYWELANAYKNDLSQPSSFLGGKSFAGFLISHLADFFTVPGNSSNAKVFKKKLFDEVSDRLTNKKELEETQNALGSFKYLAPLKNVFRVFSLFNDKKSSLQELLNFSATLIENPKSPKATALIYDVSKDFSKLPTPQAARKPDLRETLPPPFSQDFVENLKHLLLDTEFTPQTSLNDDVVQWRAQQVMDDYWHQVVTGRHKMNFENAEDFKNFLKPLLDDLAQPGALEAALHFLNYMDHNPYDPQWWEDWFQRLSSNIRAIPYYYPGNYPDADGDGRPTIRLVNQLELLDLVVIDSDFTLKEIHQWRPDIIPDSIFPPEDENGAIRYLTKLAQADDASTPQEVERLTQAWVDGILDDEARYIDVVFHGGEKLLEDETAIKIRHTTLHPLGKRTANQLKKRFLQEKMQPETRRRVFNLNQVLPILKELNQNKQRAKLRNGKEVWRSDLGILRGLFHAVLQATPQGRRNVYTKDANSLRFITHLVTSGIFRAISINMWSQDSRGTYSTRIKEILKLIIDATCDHDTWDHLNQDTKEILNFLIRKNAKPGYGIFDNRDTYRRSSFNDHFVFLGQLIDHVFDWMEHDGHHGNTVLTLLKRSSYELSILMEQMEHDRSQRDFKANLPRELIKVLKPFVGTSEGTEWISSHMDTVKSLLTDPDSTKFLVRLIQTKDHSKKKHGFTEKEGSKDFIGLTNDALTELAKDNAHLANTAKNLVIRLDQDPHHIYFSQMNEAFHSLNHDPSFKIFKKQTLSPLMDELIYGMINPGNEKAWPIQLRNVLATDLKNGDISSLIEYIGNHSQNDYFFNQDFSFLEKKKYIEGMQSTLSKLGFKLYDIFKAP